MGQKKDNESVWREACHQGYRRALSHPLFQPFDHHVRLCFDSTHLRCPTPHPFTVDQYGYFFVRPTPHWSSEQWTYAISIGLLHLGLGHFQASTFDRYTHASTFLEAHRFLTGLKFCSPSQCIELGEHLPKQNASFLSDWLAEHAEDRDLISLFPYPKESTGFCTPSLKKPYAYFKPTNYEDVFALGIRNALDVALDVASGRRESLFSKSVVAHTAGQKARNWLLANYPLLSGVASYFELIESMDVCRKLQVDVGMIDVGAKKVYLNPIAGLSDEEWIWVLAHEYLHAGLNHCARQNGRDPHIWNVACDFAINGWLEALRIGSRPQIGVMHDPQFKGWSAERIYEHLTQHLRVLRKWCTLAGPGLLDFRGSAPVTDTDGDKFCREALCQGAFRHQQKGRGELPADLSESIRALEQPIIPWDVKLGQWFALHVAYPDRKRTYTRPSRRQDSSPDTPLPRTVMSELERSNAHTFGVILDTSGSMSRTLLAKCLGTIAQYALAHEVPGIRVVFCDTMPYDAGYIRPDDLLHQPITVRGRGGTALASSVQFLEQAEDFPLDAPLLILTDGATDVFDVKRTHGFVLPKNHRLPFSPRGDVFYMSE
jgi:predicted metal-dependent peptidase